MLRNRVASLTLIAGADCTWPHLYIDSLNVNMCRSGCRNKFQTVHSCATGPDKLSVGLPLKYSCNLLRMSWYAARSELNQFQDQPAVANPQLSFILLLIQFYRQYHSSNGSANGLRWRHPWCCRTVLHESCLPTGPACKCGAWQLPTPTGHANFICYTNGLHQLDQATHMHVNLTPLL